MQAVKRAMHAFALRVTRNRGSNPSVCIRRKIPYVQAPFGCSIFRLPLMPKSYRGMPSNNEAIGCICQNGHHHVLFQCRSLSRKSYCWQPSSAPSRSQNINGDDHPACSHAAASGQPKLFWRSY